MEMRVLLLLGLLCWTARAQVTQNSTEDEVAETEPLPLLQHVSSTTRSDNSEEQHAEVLPTQEVTYSNDLADTLDTTFSQAESPQTLRDDSYSKALSDLSEAVRSLLPLREHMAVAAECREGREVAMQTVISELRGRIVQLEQQVTEAQEAERSCRMDEQATRALGLEVQLAECRGKYAEAERALRRDRPSSTTLLRLELVNGPVPAAPAAPTVTSSEQEDEAASPPPPGPGSGTLTLKHLVEAMKTAGSELFAGMENKIGDIYTITKQTREFVESLQENESEDLGDEVARVTAMLNASEASGLTLRAQLEDLRGHCKEAEASKAAKCGAALAAQQGFGNASLEQLRSECEASVQELRSNLTRLHELHDCTRLVKAAGAEVQARCDSETARLQQQSVGYIVQLHAECNASLVQVRGACEQEVHHCSSKLAALNIEWNDSLISSMQTKCDDEKTVLKNQLQTQEVACANVTMTLQRCEVRNSLTQAGTAELREQVLSLKEQVEALNYSQNSYGHNLADKLDCKGFASASALVEPGVKEVSIRVGNRLYIVGSKLVTREEAWRTCRDKEMWLLTLETANELAELRPRIQLLATEATAVTTHHSLWVSARRVAASGWFQWDCAGVALEPWGAQSFDSQDEECLAIDFPRKLGGGVTWSDVACDLRLQYACEAHVEG